MKKFCIISLILLGSYFNSQTVVLNDKLLLQLTKNQTVRLASNESFLKSFEKQRKAYDDINNKITQAIAIQEYIYQQLVNVNYAIKQGKQLIYVYNYFGEIAQNLEELRKLTGRSASEHLRAEVNRLTSSSVSGTGQERQHLAHLVHSKRMPSGM